MDNSNLQKEKKAITDHLNGLYEYEQTSKNMIREKCLNKERCIVFWESVLQYLFLKEKPILEKRLKKIEWELWRLALSDTERVAQPDIAKLKQLPITEFIPFNRAGFASCLWHNEKTASLKYYPKTNTVHCFGACAKSWDVIDVVQQMHTMTFLQACQFLSKN